MHVLIHCTLLLIFAAATCANADTLEEVTKRGYLRCGVIEGSPGFTSVNDDGERVGFDIDHCKTISAAVFGEIQIEYIPITPHTVFTLLQGGSIDIFPDGATWTCADADIGLQAYQSDRCDAFTNERASTAGRIAGWPDRNDHVILTEVISKEPMAAMVRQGDPRWRDIALWSFNVQIAAEELGINQGNVDEIRAHTENAEAKRLLGLHGDLGEALGLSNDWAYNIIKLVGSYPDLWARNFEPLGLERGLNANWKDGGLHSALPFR